MADPKDYIKDDRTREIISQIRQNIGAMDTAKVTNRSLFTDCNFVQDEIFLFIGGMQTEFNVDLLKNQESYDFVDESCLEVKKVLPNWRKGELTFKPYSVWDEYRDLTGNQPELFTIFNGKFYVSPVPSDDKDSLKIWGIQSVTISQMDRETPPELPHYCDYCIILGVSARYVPEKYLALFQAQQALIKPRFRIKYTGLQVKQTNW